MSRHRTLKEGGWIAIGIPASGAPRRSRLANKGVDLSSLPCGPNVLAPVVHHRLHKFRATIMHLVVGQGVGRIEAHDAEVPQLLTVIRRPRDGIGQGTGIASWDEFL